jgi:hypothetical protein
MLFLLLTRTQTPRVDRACAQLVRMGVDARIIVDEPPTRSSKRVLYLTDEQMDAEGWTHHMSQARNRITAWDKATFIAYHSGEDHVWICEDDVYWNRPAAMRALLGHRSEADLVAHPLAESYAEDPSWYHWDKVQLMTRTRAHWSATFNQLCRLSKRLLHAVASLAHTRHRLFFHEGMFATLCRQHNWPIESYRDWNLPMWIEIRWNHPFTQEQIDTRVEEHGLVLLHPVKMDLDM